MITGMQQLLTKYNVPVPRYTSYPTVPNWHEITSTSKWRQVFSEQFNIHNTGEGLSLYIHLPFCESLCTYCGCNKKITRQHYVENTYIDAVVREWKLYTRLMTQTPIIREVHLGGGTPTFFSPENLVDLLTRIFSDAIIHPQHAFSFEGHPNNTTAEHLKALYQMGFRRVSYGVQDSDPLVQKMINRVQPMENVRIATETARSIGFTSVNFDLIYGLPFQNVDSMRKTFEDVLALKPDRIAFYNYAHVPWKSKAQRLFTEMDLPSADLKMQLYRLGKEVLTNAGYTDIGMDHFALPGDELYKAYEQGKLHRNFMGYTTTNSSLLLSLGISSISDAGVAYVQNVKDLAPYYKAIDAGELPVVKGYYLNDIDKVFRKHILDIACKGMTIIDKHPYQEIITNKVLPKLTLLEEDGLVVLKDNKKVIVTPLGHHFIRNICNAFDVFQPNGIGAINQYSKAI
ncbi:oxygen-independent coproporphyrinogen-3 oxidase [Chitinophaga skermanii]|uniref:Coproporphyrinogen-III oxidase n=1 Tax=Chitinophaga skermanii TaxID=331697 RepID=A0A327Q629_9BACT|nr:oxygen-independent coproporphyrinogen III oxidase [Chitinophaga skermanii]RAI98662.1 oxygen-independent coproporphyrinogen-3 oxidase [Chitinophaga skermanii]